MTNILKDLEALERKISEFPEIRISTQTFSSEFSKIINFLEASQYELYQMMQANNIWKGDPIPDPGGTGELEYGLFPHWINEPPDFIKDFLAKHAELDWIWYYVLAAAVPNHIDHRNYTELLNTAQTEGVIAADGTYYGEGKGSYGQLDPNWLWSFADYLLVLLGDKADFPTIKPKPISMQGKSSEQVTIAMLGDWGTGSYPTGSATEIMNQINEKDPDYIIHLGDVYYSGTPDATHLFQPPNEELDHLINLWPERPAGTSFTMNSNHEMYSGGKGLFGVALQDDTPFSAQRGASYFALQFAGWTILGLDSAYFTTSSLYMVGAIGGDGDPQPEWIQKLNLSPDKVIMLTHHNGLDYKGSTEPAVEGQPSFWDQVSAALGGDPAAWYWGHIHNGIVYKKPTVTGKETLARCLGHASIPFGKAWGIEQDHTHVEKYTDTPNKKVKKNRVLNGYVMLTISASGLVTEEYFQQGNNDQAWYTNSYG